MYKWYVHVESDEHAAKGFDSYEQAFAWGKLNAERCQWWGWQIWCSNTSNWKSNQVYEEGYEEAD
jgi:hypothetical protein